MSKTSTHDHNNNHIPKSFSLIVYAIIPLAQRGFIKGLEIAMLLNFEKKKFLYLEGQK